ncbi:MAG: hypothetical protein RIT27_238 [Pseudomonadota bacterium]|jgi:uncharacterized membrane protein YoaK (UPF0700 family)
MSVFSDPQIVKFQNALQGPAPSYDPNWQITKQLVKLTTLQSQYILELQAQLDSYMNAQEASSTVLLEALQNSSATEIEQTPISEAQATAAMRNLEQAITDYQNGKQVAQYTGTVLKFASLLLL